MRHAQRAKPRSWLIVLLAAAAGLTLFWPSPRPPHWRHLLSPYSSGASLPGGFRIGEMGRGPTGEVLLNIRRKSDAATVEVAILVRGRWSGIRESRSFGIAYEIGGSSASKEDCEAVTEAIATVIRSRDSGLPSPSAIPLESDGAHWPESMLESLRGPRGFLFGVVLLVTALCLLAPTGGLLIGLGLLVFCGLALRLSGMDAGARFLDPGKGWLVVGACLLLAASWRSGRVLPASEYAMFFVLLTLALGMRLWLGTWGPLHVNGLGPLWVIGGLLNPGELEPYGPGYFEVYGGLLRWLPGAPDTRIFLFNAGLSAATVSLVFCLGRRLGISSRPAVAGAVVLMLDPGSLRMAVTESYLNGILFFCTLSGILLLRSLEQFDRGSASWGVMTFGAAGLFACQAIRMHPCGWLPVALLPLVAIARTTEAPFPFRYLVVTGMGLCGLILATSGDVLIDVYSRIQAAVLMQPPPPPSFEPLLGVLAVGVVGLALTRSTGLVLAGGASLSACLMSRHIYGQSLLWQESYDRLFVVLPILLAVACVPKILWRIHLVLLIASLLVASAWFRDGVPLVKERTTEQLEYAWLRPRLKEIPSRCRVIHLAGAGKRGLYIPTYVRSASSEAVAINPRQPFTLSAALAPTDCLYYVRGSLCSSNEGRSACAGLEERLELAPVAREALPARPSHSGLPYDSDSVEIVVNRATLR